MSDSCLTGAQYDDPGKPLSERRKAILVGHNLKVSPATSDIESCGIDDALKIHSGQSPNVSKP
jgi:hypothetical protein